MRDDANGPEAVPVLERAGPPRRWPAALLLGIGAGIGLVLGVALTVGVAATYSLFTIVTPAPLPAQDMGQVFQELNDLRQQINRDNEQRRLADEQTAVSIRRALDAVAATARPVRAGAPAPAPGGGPAPAPAARAHDPFAELDAEIKRLEDTQRVLNAVLDMFTPKERPKDRPGATGPPR
jgi:hypothetical protein